MLYIILAMKLESDSFYCLVSIVFLYIQSDDLNLILVFYLFAFSSLLVCPLYAVAVIEIEWLTSHFQKQSTKSTL